MDSITAARCSRSRFTWGGWGACGSRRVVWFMYVWCMVSFRYVCMVYV